MFKNTVLAKQNMMAGYLHPRGPLAVKLWFEEIINLDRRDNDQKTLSSLLPYILENFLSCQVKKRSGLGLGGLAPAKNRISGTLAWAGAKVGNSNWEK